MGDDFKTRSDKRRFISKLEAVSGSLAVWAQERLHNDGWSIEDCKMHLRNAMKVAEVERQP